MMGIGRKLAIVLRPGIQFLVMFAATAGAEDMGPAKEPARFSVATEIEMSEFVDPVGGLTNWYPINYSPDRQHFAVVTERGVLGRNVLEDTLWVFNVNAVRDYLKRSDKGRTLGLPLATLSAKQRVDGSTPIISQVRWLDDSKGLAFVGTGMSGAQELFKIDLRTKQLRLLSKPSQNVTGFDIRNGIAVYSALSPLIDHAYQAESQSPALVASGRTLGSILLAHKSQDLNAAIRRGSLNEVWLTHCEGGQTKPLRLEDHVSHQPVYSSPVTSVRSLWLSPDGKTLLVLAPVRRVPKEWEHFSQGSHWLAQAFHADDRANISLFETGDLGKRVPGAVSQYVLVDLRNRRVTPVVNAPTGWGVPALWQGANPGAAWSKDGKQLILGNSFIPYSATSVQTRPCIMVVAVKQMNASCIAEVPSTKDLNAANVQLIDDFNFLGAPNGGVILGAHTFAGTRVQQSLEKRDGGLWLGTGKWMDADPGSSSIEISVKQDLNHPPVLSATDPLTRNSKTIFDPNPTIAKLALGEVTEFTWTDGVSGTTWRGGLVKPPNFDPGKKYPLVVQTHAFNERMFLSNGGHSTGMAARELAAAGIVVLQIETRPSEGDAGMGTSNEIRVQSHAYEAAVNELERAGFVDRNRVGLTGFSRTGFYVMDALFAGGIKYAAGIMTDASTGGYIEYMSLGPSVAADDASLIGSRPFGAGLQKWFVRSPEFNLDKVGTPLRIELRSNEDMVAMWEPYAALSDLGKPVDAILLNSDEHELTNPLIRMVSQQGAVDWYRFWLQGYEDLSPDKAEQYRRWEKLCDLQAAQIAGRPIYCVTSKR